MCTSASEQAGADAHCWISRVFDDLHSFGRFDCLSTVRFALDTVRRSPDSGKFSDAPRETLEKRMPNWSPLSFSFSLLSNLIAEQSKWKSSEFDKCSAFFRFKVEQREACRPTCGGFERLKQSLRFQLKVLR